MKLSLILTIFITIMFVHTNAIASGKSKAIAKVITPTKLAYTSAKSINSYRPITATKVSATGARLRNTASVNSIKVAPKSTPVIKSKPTLTPDKVKSVGENIRNTPAVRNVPKDVKLRSMQNSTRISYTTPRGRYEIDLNRKGRNGGWPSHNGLMTPHTKFSPVNPNAPAHIKNKFNSSDKFAKYSATTQQEMLYAKKALENRTKKTNQAGKK